MFSSPARRRFFNLKLTAFTQQPTEHSEIWAGSQRNPPLSMSTTSASVHEKGGREVYHDAQVLVVQSLQVGRYDHSR